MDVAGRSGRKQRGRALKRAAPASSVGGQGCSPSSGRGRLWSGAEVTAWGSSQVSWCLQERGRHRRRRERTKTSEEPGIHPFSAAIIMGQKVSVSFAPGPHRKVTRRHTHVYGVMGPWGRAWPHRTPLCLASLVLSWRWPVRAGRGASCRQGPCPTCGPRGSQGTPSSPEGPSAELCPLQPSLVPKLPLLFPAHAHRKGHGSLASW